jgi:uncharacterized protein YebE (UPF0316 family)
VKVTSLIRRTSKNIKTFSNAFVEGCLFLWQIKTNVKVLSLVLFLMSIENFAVGKAFGYGIFTIVGFVELCVLLGYLSKSIISHINSSFATTSALPEAA